MKTAEAFYQEALSVQENEPEKAIELYKSATEVDPVYTNAYNGWGNTLLQLERPEEAIPLYEKCIFLDPKYQWAMHNLASIYEKSDPENAIELYERATVIDPSYVAAFNGWGNVLVKLGRTDEAKSLYEKCIALNPEFQWAMYNLAELYEKSDPEKSIDLYRRATKIDPDYTNAFNGWGNTLLKLGRTDEAKTFYEKCIAIDSNYKWAIYNLASIYEKSEPNKAIELYKRAIEIDPDYANAFAGWGNALLNQSLYEEAIELYKQATQIDPKYPDAYYGWGNACLDLKQHEIAREKYTHCIELDPDHQWAYHGYYVSIARSDKKQSLTDTFSALVEAKKSVYGYWSLANLYQYTLKDYQKSLQFYDISITLGHADDRFLDISNLHDTRGDLQKALDVVEETLEQDPDSIYAHYNKAYFLFKMGEYKKSREIWRKVIDKFKGAFSTNALIAGESLNYLYCGNIYYEFFGKIAEAEELYKRGVQLDKMNMRLLLGLNQLHAKKDKLTIRPDISDYWKRNTNIRCVEAHFENLGQVEEDLFQLAEMYFIEEEHEKALLLINQHLKEGPESSNWYNLQGQVFMATENYSKAVTSFQKAIKLEAHNIGHHVNLANALLKNKNTYEAEIAFLKIVKRDPNNVDALIGLGEIYLNKSHDDKDEYLIDKAESYLQEAITLGKSDKASRRLDLFTPKGSNERRKYKDLKLSELYYSMGYIKAKRFERKGIGFDPSLLNESLSYFKRSHEADPDNLKAIAAQAKIERNLKTNRKSSRLEHFGALAITTLSFTVFLLCQYFFYFHSVDHEPERYSLSDSKVSYIESIFALPEVQTNKLQGLSNIEFEDEATLIGAIQEILGSEQLANKQNLLNKVDLSVEHKVNSDPLLTAGYYTLISFSALMFMIAGLYLPKLLKLKVGVIEIEKNSPSEVNNITSLGIQKF